MPEPANTESAGMIEKLKRGIEKYYSSLIFIGAPIMIVALVLWGATYNLYRYYLLAAPEMSLTDVAFRLAAISYNAPGFVWNSLLVTFDDEKVEAESELPTFRIRLETNSLKKMTSRLPFSAKEKYYRAWLVYPDGVERQISYRLRGRSRWHWLPQKPSFRLRLPRKSPMDLQRHINLVNPEDNLMVSNFMGDELARRSGLLSFDTRFARLFVNDQYFGVYHVTLREDESFLRRQGKIPGPMYIGDNIQDPWDNKGFETVGDVRVLGDVDPMKILTEAMYKPESSEKYDDIWSILSMEKYAAWHAVMALTAGTHSDNFHNHLFYFDPRLGKLEPAIVDTNGHGMFHFMKGRKQLTQGYEPDPTIPFNEPREPLRDVTFRDPRFYHLRNRKIFELLNGRGSVDSQHGILDRTYKMIDADVHADHRKAGVRPSFAGGARKPYSNGQYEEEKHLIYRWIEGRDQFLRKHLDRVAVRARLAQHGEDVLLHIEITGHAAVRFNADTSSGNLSADVRLDGSFIKQVSEPVLLYPGLTENQSATHRFVNVFEIPPHYLSEGKQSYLFRFANNSTKSISTALSGAFRNAVTDKSVAADVAVVEQIDIADVQYDRVSRHVWLFPETISERKSIGPGLVYLDEDLVIGPSEVVEINPGTRIEMAPDISILAYGKLTINGTADDPVEMVRKIADKPWGSVVFSGAGASGSAIRYFRASGGSVGRAGYSLVSGMISAYGVTDFHISDTELSANSLSDDLLHIVYGNYSISRTRLSNCYADCIDIDYGTGTIEGVVIDNAGNDGIDFMSARADLKNIVIGGAGDKGISAGEASDLHIDNLAVSGAVHGLAAKDKSRVKLRRSLLKSNQTAVSAYAKNWRYGGAGIVEGHDVKFIGNEVSMSVEKSGAVILSGQPLPDRRHGDGVMTSNE
jgi:hypothetical protein